MPKKCSLIAATAAVASTIGASNALAQVVLFAPGTPIEYQEQVTAEILARLGRTSAPRYNAVSRWPGNPGEPINLTWSFAPDGVGPLPGSIGSQFENPGNSELFFRFDAAFGSRALWTTIISESFQREETADDPPGSIRTWGNLSGINFTQVTAPPDMTDPENVIFFDWDTGDQWDETGSVNGPTTPTGGGGLAPAMDTMVGDIRFASKAIDGFGGAVGYAFPPDDPDYPGEIVLDFATQWTRPDVDFRYMRNIISQFIGIAVGLDVACPFSNARLMEPLGDRTFTGPQIDDLRGIQALYGDYFEINDVRDQTMVPNVLVDPVNALLGQFFVFDNISLDENVDQDVFAVVFPDIEVEDYFFDMRVTASPIGTTYLDGPSDEGSCVGVETDEINALSIRNLKISVLDSELNVIDAFDPTDPDGQPLPTDPGGFVDESGIGLPEGIRNEISAAGVYYVVIAGSTGNQDPSQSQLYSLSLEIGNQIFSDGITYDEIALLQSPIGLGTASLNDVLPGFLPAGETAVSGKNTRVGHIDARYPSIGHATTEFLSGPAPLPENDFPPQRFAWPGNAIAPAAIGGVSSHATYSLACAIGNPVGVFPNGFIGPAFEASWMAASVGTRVFGGNAFLTSKESLLYGLFGLADPSTALLTLGLPDTATIINNPWGSGGDYRGDSLVSHYFDAITQLTDVAVITSAGNNGAIDQTPQCGGFGGNTPGSLFRGSRTLGFPATAFNTVTVGFAGKELLEGEVSDPDLLDPSASSYILVADRSSKGPIDSFDYETSVTTPNNRPGIDLVGAGTGYVVRGINPLELDPPGDQCNYPGHNTAVLISLPAISSAEPDPDNPADPEFFSANFGSSVAVGGVTGGCALLQDYMIEQGRTLDPTVLRAILLTSAVKLEGWSNNGIPARPQDNRDGVDAQTNDNTVDRQTTQVLDWAQGAGFPDFGSAHDVLRGRYADPTLDSLISGDPTDDVAITDPTIPTIVTPPNENELILPFPGNAPEAASIDSLPPSPIEIARKLRLAREGSPADNFMLSLHGDFGDPDIGQVGGVKSASGINFEARPPFNLPPSPDRPGGGANDEVPLELDPEVNRIVVNPIGWDHAMVGQRVLRMPANDFFQGGGVRAGYIDYFIAYAFDGVGDVLTASLCWLRNVRLDTPDFTDIDNPVIGEIETIELENLELELIQTDALGNIIDDHVFLGVIGQDDNGVIWANSTSALSNIEHIHTKTPGRAPGDDDEIIPAGFYILRVRWLQQDYDLFNNSVRGSVEYGLAWKVTPLAAEARGPSLPVAQPSQFNRVMNMFFDAIGSAQGDANFNASFDVDRDGAITVHDFGKIAAFWAGR